MGARSSVSKIHLPDGGPTSVQPLAWILNTVAVLVYAWVSFGPGPQPLALLAAAMLPWLAMSLVLILRHSLGRDVRLIGKHSIGTCCLVFSGLAMVGGYGAWGVPLAWAPIWALTIAGALVFAGIAAAVDPPRSRPLASLALLTAIGGLYTLGAVNNGNVLLDRSSADIHRVKIVGKHVERGRPTST